MKLRRKFYNSMCQCHWKMVHCNTRCRKTSTHCSTSQYNTQLICGSLAATSCSLAFIRVKVWMHTSGKACGTSFSTPLVNSLPILQMWLWLVTAPSLILRTWCATKFSNLRQALLKVIVALMRKTEGIGHCCIMLTLLVALRAVQLNKVTRALL